MRIVMMGTGTFAEPTFEALLTGPHPVVGLVTQPDRAAARSAAPRARPARGMKDIALEHSFPVFQPESINTPEGVAGLRELQPDLLVVAAYGQILSHEVLAVPPHGGINVHASLLPKYRGAAPDRLGHLPRRDADRRDHHPHVDLPGRRRHPGPGGARHRARRDGRRAGSAAGAARAPGWRFR